MEIMAWDRNNLLVTMRKQTKTTTISITKVYKIRVVYIQKLLTKPEMTWHNDETMNKMVNEPFPVTLFFRKPWPLLPISENPLFLPPVDGVE